jgi:hypothetical protein
MQETYCISDDSCFHFLKGVIPNGYYGIKLKLIDSGTSSLKSEETLCVRIPANRGFYLDSVYERTKAPLRIGISV